MQEGVLCEALAYVIYIRERYYFSLVYISKKVVNFFEVKVDVQKGPLGFREFFYNNCASFIQFMFSSIIVIWS